MPTAQNKSSSANKHGAQSRPAPPTNNTPAASQDSAMSDITPTQPEQPEPSQNPSDPQQQSPNANATNQASDKQSAGDDDSNKENELQWDRFDPNQHRGSRRNSFPPSAGPQCRIACTYDLPSKRRRNEEQVMLPTLKLKVADRGHGDNDAGSVWLGCGSQYQRNYRTQVSVNKE